MEFLKTINERIQLKQTGLDDEHNKWANEDLVPSTPEQRTWRWYHVGGFWISEGFNLAQMQTVSSAVALGLNPGLAVGACLVGNVLVILACAASGYLGARYGINFPVLIRASFGMWGAYLAVLFRGVFCFILYGVQGVLGGTAVLAMLTAMSPNFATWHENSIPNSLGITAPGMVSFWVFWIASFPFLFLSIPTLRWLFLIKIVLVPFFYIAIFTWALTAGGGWGPLFSIPNKITNGFSVTYTFFMCMSAAIGSNATFALNMADVCRYSKNTREGWMSQLWAGPLFLTLTELLGAILGATSQVVYGQILFNPVAVILLWDNRAAKFFAGLMLAFCNIGTNVSGNSLPFGNDITAWFPKYFNIRRGQILCAIIGVLIQPWYINAKASTFMAFISGYSIFLGPICGVMITDYWVVRKNKGIDLIGCYESDGPYKYWNGINLKAMAAIAVAIALNMPGLLYSMGVHVANKGILNYYCVTWVSGVIVAGLVYVILSTIFPPSEIERLEVYVPDENGIIYVNQADVISGGSINVNEETKNGVISQEKEV